MATKYYCIKCDAQLNSQIGFSHDLYEWTCTECGECLNRDKIRSGAQKEGDWRCEECGALLNTQYGFSTDYTRWMCTKCAHTNVKDAEVKGSRCPSCGSRLREQGGYSEYSSEWTCADCGAELYRDFSFEDYRVKENSGAISTEDRTTPAYTDTPPRFTAPEITVGATSFDLVDTIGDMDIDGGVETSVNGEDSLPVTDFTNDFLHTGGDLDTENGENTVDGSSPECEMPCDDAAADNADWKNDLDHEMRKKLRGMELRAKFDRRRLAMEGRVDTSNGKCYFCPKCGDVLNEQYGFRLNKFSYVCRRCNESLVYFCDADYFTRYSDALRMINDPDVSDSEEFTVYKLRNAPKPISDIASDFKSTLLPKLEKAKNKKNEIRDLIICFFFGTLGVHKFIDGKYFVGLLYLFTGGLFGLGWLLDLIIAFEKIQK